VNGAQRWVLLRLRFRFLLFTALLCSYVPRSSPSSSQKSRSGTVSFKTSTTNANCTSSCASCRGAGLSCGGVCGSSSGSGSGGEAYSTSASLAVFGTAVTRRCSAQRSEKSRPRAGRAVVAAKTEMGVVGRRDEEDWPWLDGLGEMSVFRRRVRML
jgi:hypothetical protein